MSAINGISMGVLTAYAILDPNTGELHPISEVVGEGAQGPVGPKGEKGDKGDTGSAGAKGNTGSAGADGVGVTSVAASRTDNTVTLTFTLSDNSTIDTSFDLPTT